MIASGGNIQMKIINKFGNEVSMRNIRGAYGDFKDLYEFYESQKNVKVSAQEMRNRVAYILKHGVKQRTEIETICWILGEDLVDVKR